MVRLHDRPLMITSSSQIFPIGIGTFGLGANPTESGAVEVHANQEDELQTLLYGFGQGQNYIETTYHYAEGETLKFLAKFLSKIPREKIFVTAKLFKPFTTQSEVEEQVELTLTGLGLDYVDSLSCTPVTLAGKISLEEAYTLMKSQTDAGKSRYLGGSNLNLEKLKRIKAMGIQLFVMEGLYNLECKMNEDLGIIDYANKNYILFAAYQPLRRNRTANRHYPIVDRLVEKYQVTPNQILINWLTKHKKMFILLRAGGIKHVKENLAALDFSMELGDYMELDRFRNREFEKFEIDWDNRGGTPIYMVPNLLP